MAWTSRATWTRWVSVGDHGPRGRSPAHLAEGRRPPGNLFLRRLRPCAKHRGYSRHQRVRDQSGTRDGEGRERPHRRASAEVGARPYGSVVRDPRDAISYIVETKGLEDRPIGASRAS